MLQSAQKLFRTTLRLLFLLTSRVTHAAFKALNFVSKSTKPMPPINVFLLILSLLFHRKLKISLFVLLKKSWHLKY